MKSKIIDRKIIELNEQQTRMVISGWGKDVYQGSIVEKITYLSDGLKVKGYVAYPAEAISNGESGSSNYPCVIWNRGGSKESGAIDSFTARGIFGQLASWGYVVFASQYRGNAGGEGQEQLGGDDVNDILNLIPLAGELPFADSSNWGIEGWSRGGMMTYLTLLRNRNFKCAVLSGAITNLEEYLNSQPEKEKIYKKLIGEGNFEVQLKKRMIVNHTGELPKIPFLLMHGGDDKTVSPIQTIEMSKKMIEQNIPYRLVIFEGGDHFLKNHREEVDRLRKFWLDKYLKS